MVIKQCNGNARVIQWVSMSHPKIFFVVEKTASPLPSFDFETTDLDGESMGL